MKVTIKDYCIRCMMCQTMCPELFELDFENDVMRVKMDEVPDNLVETVRNVIGDCAVTAIFIQRSGEGEQENIQGGRDGIRSRN